MQKKEKRKNDLLNQIKIKLESWFYVILSIYILYRTHYLNVLLNDPKIGSIFKFIFLFSLGSMSSIVLFIAYYLPHKGFNDVDNYNKNIIPISAIIGGLALFSSIISAWPIFKLWGVFINIIFILGFVNVGNLLPKNDKIGSIVMILIFLSVCYYSYYF